ncbi:MAG: hypothetical protein KGL53_04580, partial [Elusimicrobia bacterium]|nr:hypothetical protein [Elusimicrobiota bacterium]
YLALQILAWFPLSAKMEALLDMLLEESDPEVVATISRQILAGLGSDPIPLAAALGAHPGRARLMGHAVRLFTAQNWDPTLAPTLLAILAHPPLSLADSSPATYAAVCAHLFSYGAVTLQELWRLLGEEGRRKLLLRLLVSFMRDRARLFPALPLEFLADAASEGDPERRELLYALLAEDGRPDSAEALAAALSRESDDSLRSRGAGFMRAMLGSGA